jgi:hypothetical protein
MNTMSPITEHEFYDRYYACSTSHSIFHRTPFHRCIQFHAHERERLNRLPKRKSSIIDANDAADEFWGLLAKERPSFLIIFLYHLLFLGPCILFFFMWLFKWRHSGDLQNASVPFTVALGGLSAFWALFAASLKIH